MGMRFEEIDENFWKAVNISSEHQAFIRLTDDGYHAKVELPTEAGIFIDEKGRFDDFNRAVAFCECADPLGKGIIGRPIMWAKMQVIKEGE